MQHLIYIETNGGYTAIAPKSVESVEMNGSEVTITTKTRREYTIKCMDFSECEDRFKEITNLVEACG